MSDKSNIEWTDATWNPVRGCTRVSEGCRNCYAETLTARWEGGWGKGFAELGAAGNARWTGHVAMIPNKLRLPLSWKQPRRIFVNSLSDLFHEALTDDEIGSVFAVMAEATQHIFQVLTKRPKRMLEYTTRYQPAALPNVWLGVSAERQHEAHERVPLLLDTPATVRFVSAEPLLGPITFLRGLDWIIVGGESGRERREMEIAWVEQIAAQATERGTALFVKQDSALRPGQRGRIPDHLWTRKEFPTRKAHTP